MFKVVISVLFCFFVTIWGQYADANGSRPRTPEKDPVFLQSPVSYVTKKEVDILKSVTVEDVVKVKNMEETIRATIQEESAGLIETEPIQQLSGPPPDPQIGDIYVNSDSGATCYYICRTLAGAQDCAWVFTPSAYQGLWQNEGLVDFYAAPCKPANTGEAPDITFPEYSYGIADLSDCTGDAAYFTADVVEKVADIWSAVFLFVRLSTSPDATGGWDDPPTVISANSYKSGMPAFKVTADYDVLAGVLRVRGDVQGDTSSWYIISEYLMPDLEEGVYGFQLEVIDTEHNRTVSDYAPLKIRYVKPAE
jgi:hypothetical protein